MLLGLLTAAYYLAHGLAQAIDIDILGHHPFGGISRAIESYVVTWVNDGRKATEGVITDLLHGLTWSLGLLGRAIDALGLKTEQAFRALRHVSVPALIGIAVSPLAALAGRLALRLSGVERTLTAEVKRLEALVQIGNRATLQTAERDIGRAVTRVTDDLAGRLRAVEQTLRAETAREIGAVGAAEHTLAGRLGRIEQLAPAASLAALLAAFPLLRTELLALEAETGLDRAGCRSKIRDVCQTDPAGWAGMLAGLAALTFALSLKELLPVAREGIRLYGPEVRRAA